MASISTYKGAAGDTLRAIQFMGSDRKRRTIRLGTLPARDVEDIKGKIDLLEIYRKNNRAPDTETAKWLGATDDGIIDKLAAGGLCEPRTEAAKPKGLNLGAYLESYLGNRLALVEAGKLTADSLRIEMVTRDCLVQKFGSDKLVGSFRESDAEDFRHYLLTIGGQPVKRCGSETVILPRRPLAESTTRKRCAMASKFFRAAVRRGLVARNPFDCDSVPKANVATSKHAYIKAADAKAILERLPGTQWQLLFALCRWGGLRIGETRLLTWGDIQWDENRILVHSPKTARYQGHATRLVPLFPELAELLDKRYHEAVDGEQQVLPMMEERSNASFRKVLERAIVAAGVAPWPRLWHNLRGTRQNELLEAGFKRKAVCSWLGNSSDTADEHYEKCTEADWTRASAPHFAPPSQNMAETR